MRFVFGIDILADRSAQVDLSGILGKVADGWHFWQIDDVAATEASEFVAAMGDRKLLEESVRAGAWSAARPHRRLIAVTRESGRSDERWEPREARRLAETPLAVLVENRFSDGAFLDAVLAAFSAPETLRIKASGGLVYDSGGGVGELPKLVEDYAAKLGRRLRAVVVRDSDARFPGDFSKEAGDTQARCAAHGVPCHILAKRAIESYVPDEVMQDWSSSPDRTSVRGKVEALLRLTPTQRDHFPMKKGLREPGPDTPQEEQALWSGVPQPDFELLRQGFQKDFVLILFDNVDARRLRTSATDEALRRRDGGAELDAIVEMIESAL